MKITNIEVTLVVDEIPSPPRVGNVAATLQVDGGANCTVACRVMTDEGLIGESYGWAFGPRRGRVIAGVVKEICGLAVGEDPLRIGQIWQKFWAFSNFVGHSGLAIIGMSVLDMALWDIKAKSVGLPLWRLLGGDRESAPAYSSHLAMYYGRPDVTIDDLVAAAGKVIDAGHRTVKVWAARPDDLEVVRTLKSSFDPSIDWAVDVVQTWDVSTALSAMERFQDLELLWLEDPVPYDDYVGMARVAARSATPICTGENLYYIYEAQRVLDETEVKYLSLDLMRCGGVSGWQLIANAARTKSGVKIVSHTYPQLAVHLVCGTANAAFVEDYPVYDGIVGDAITVLDGVVNAPTEPGTGISLAPDALARGVVEIAS